MDAVFGELVERCAVMAFGKCHDGYIYWVYGEY